MKKTIAIVGAEEEAGMEIAAHFSKVPCRLLLLSHDSCGSGGMLKNIPQHPAADLIEEPCMKDGCWESDIIVWALPDQGDDEAERISEVATQKPVVLFGGTRSRMEDLQKRLPYSQLLLAAHTSVPGEIEMSGSCAETRQEMAALFKEAGYKIKIVNP